MDNENKDVQDPNDEEELDSLKSSIKTIDLSNLEVKEKTKIIEEKIDRISKDSTIDNSLSDIERYEELKIEYPLFRQLPNGCGLSSMLMLIDPLEKTNFRAFLDKIWGFVSKILMNSKLPFIEFEWSFALEYLLIKSLSDNLLLEYLYEKQPDNFDMFSPILNYELGEVRQKHFDEGRIFIAEAYDAFFEKGIINQFILTEDIGKMKKNTELRVLFELFGYEFIPQNSPDGTGAIFFDKKELKNIKKQEVLEKLEILRSEYNKGAKIICGMYHHWLAVTKVYIMDGKWYININDPNTGQRIQLPIKKLSDTDRFYIFKRKKENMDILWQKIIEFVEKENIIEEEEFKKFKEILQAQIKKRLDEENKIKERERKIQGVKIKVEGQTVLPEVSPETMNQISSGFENSIPNPEFSDLSQNDDLKDDSHIPLSGEAFLDRIKKIIRSNFSDYSKL